MWGWGHNFILKDHNKKAPKTSGIPLPQSISAFEGLKIKQMSVGPKSAAAVSDDDKLYLWFKGKEKPISTPYKDIIQTSCGGFASLFIYKCLL